VRIVFLGTPQIAVPPLRALVEAGRAPVLVVTRPDRPARRGLEIVPPAVKRAALEAGLELHQPEKIRDRAFVERIAASEPDWLVVVAFGRILPAAVLELPRRGPVNVHFSMLPLYRGAAPVQWTLARGESSTGVTTMWMNERMDEGDILLQVPVAIEPGEHAPSLAERLSRVGASLLLDTLDRLERGHLRPVPQDPCAATYAPPLRREDGEISPALSAREIEGRVRGFDPWPGVWLAARGRRLRIVEARAIEGPATNASPGTVLEMRPDGAVLVCGSGTALLLEAVQLEGRRVLRAADAVHGRQLVVGERLEPIHGPA
jgi:methionyl-tRNA formyltransferase